MSGYPKILYYARAGNAHEVQQAVQNLGGLIEKFKEHLGVELGWEEAVLANIVCLYSRDIDKMSILDKVKPSAYRQAAALCIWLTRLKPLFNVKFNSTFTAAKERELKLRTQVNEMFALFAATVILHADREHSILRPGLDDLVKSLWGKQFDDLLTVLRYRVVSRHVIAILLQTICERGLR